MLYVFLVDSGTMYTFQMEFAMESVEALMQVIQEDALVPVDKQVLLVTGGRALLPGSRVCSYTSAGTEDNPIFMFSKSSIEAAVPPSPSLIMGSEASLKEQVDVSMRLPSTYETLVSRAKLASEFERLAVELSDSCDCLVHDQILQQQGWITAVANLENITRDFGIHANAFQSIYSSFLNKKQQYTDILTNFSEVLSLLSKIPILPNLLFTDESHKLPPGNKYSLLEWINAQDEKSSLEGMAEQCKLALNQFDSSVLSNLMSEVQAVLDTSDNLSMKEIKGLDERQAGLQQLLLSVTHLTQEQADLAKGFLQNQARALNVGDPSVLPDLCAGHQKQLLQLLKKHSHLRDLRKRCARAKDELATNLHARLRWVMFTEKRICDCDSNLILHHEHLKRLKCRLDILEQVYNTPKLYITTVAEIVRRKHFSQHFLKWASEVRESSEEVHADEITRRKHFAMFFDHHFLRNLFKGLDDKPEKLFTRPLSMFDSALPAVTEEDLTSLQESIPQLTGLLTDSLQSQDRSEKSATAEEFLGHKYSGLELELLKLPASTRLCRSDQGVYKPSETEMKTFVEKDITSQVTDDVNKKSVDSIETSDILDWHIDDETEETLNIDNTVDDGGTDSADETVMIRVSDAEFSTDEEDLDTRLIRRKPKKERYSVLRHVLERGNGNLEDSNGSLFHSASEKFVDEDDVDGGKKRNVDKTVCLALDKPLSSNSEENTTAKGSNALNTPVTLDKAIQTETWDVEADSWQAETGTQHASTSVHQIEASSLLVEASTLQLDAASQQVDAGDLQVGGDAHHIEADTQQVGADTQDLGADSQDLGADTHQIGADTQKVGAGTQLETSIGEVEVGTELEESDADLDKALVDKRDDVSQQNDTVTPLLTDKDTLPTGAEQQVTGDHEVSAELVELHKNKELLEDKVQEQEQSLSCLNSQLVATEHSCHELQQNNVTLKEGCREIRTLLTEEFHSLRQKLKESRESIVSSRNEMQGNSAEIFSQINERIEKERTISVKNTLAETKLEYDQLLNSSQERFMREMQALSVSKQQLEQEYGQLQTRLELASKEKLTIAKEFEKAKSAHEQIVSDYKNKIVGLKKSITEMHEAKLQFVAEQQVNFNNAVSKVVKEKEQLYQELQEKILSLESQNIINTETINTLKQNCEDVERLKAEELNNFAVREQEMLAKQRNLEEKIVEFERLLAEKEQQFLAELEQEQRSQLLLLEIEKQTWEDEKEKIIQEQKQHVCSGESKEAEKLKFQVQDLQQNLNQLKEENESLTSHSMMRSTIAVTPEPSVQELTQALKAREEQCHSLKSQLVHEKSDKKPSIALQDFKIGDTVLFVFEEARENYMIYTLSPMLYFLHVNSQEAMGLSTAPGKRRSFFVARIVDKEFVEAKKPNNRFRVPVGTRFYRVQAQLL